MTARACLVVALILALVWSPVGAAAANTASLKRSVENATQGPLDGLLTPITATGTAFRNVGAEEHSLGGVITLGLITTVGLFLFNGASSLFRTFAGAVEFPVALGSLAASPFTTDFNASTASFGATCVTFVATVRKPGR